ncbi:MAG: uncharacterized protein H6P98_2145 [Candidatus Aminicenantes bacterium]|nr:uncharacterized protein [Candidatus Aminicenantes bacterium]
MRFHDSLALAVPDVLLPGPGIDLFKWAVIACDQYTSEPEYWLKVQEIVGASPSSLNLIYPEVYLGDPRADARIASIREQMELYLESGHFVEAEGFVYVERRTESGLRRGLVACLDLEHYDFRKGATSLIRATEGTILSRIPPRVKIREGAPLEIPHIMVLLDDPRDTVIGPLGDRRRSLKKLYDFELMLGSGHLAGYRVEDAGLEKGVVEALQVLADPAAFAAAHGLQPGTPVLLYAMGDGNHSLATAKTIWEKTKETAEDPVSVMRSPLRHALVELVNLHDPALVFEPIHRVLFDLAPERNLIGDMERYYRGRFRFAECQTPEEVMRMVDRQKGSPHRIGLVTSTQFGALEVFDSDSNLPVGTLQNFLDRFMEEKGAREIDYIHGTEAVIRLGRKSGGAAFYLPAMDKSELFKTVILDGALPRKTFSMGEAAEKRFYMEARKLAKIIP